MSNTNTIRVDGVAKYYDPAEKLDAIGGVLFWLNAIFSFIMPYSAATIGEELGRVLQAIFLVSVLVYFAISQILNLYLVPRAELMRRKQLISNSFGIPLSQDNTSLYYNNSYSPSVKRLGANTMENALFSKEIASKMLVRKRIIIFGYLFMWLLAFSLRHNNLELLTWITQLVFSGEILAGWLKLEILRFRHDRIYDELYSHFLHELGQNSPSAVANILNAFVSYESAKSNAGILLSTKEFQKLNPTLSKRWLSIRQKLGMEDKINLGH